MRVLKELWALGAPAVILAVSILASVQSAQATPIKWTFADFSFADGGTAAGSFIYDADTNDYFSISITTSGGALTGATYNVDNNAFGFLSTANSMMALTGLPVNLNDRVFWMGFSTSLTNAGGPVDFSFAQETGCVLVSGGLCQGIVGTSPTRNFSTGRIVGTTISVPEPTTIAIFCVGLAGLIFIGYRRRA